MVIAHKTLEIARTDFRRRRMIAKTTFILVASFIGLSDACGKGARFEPNVRQIDYGEMVSEAPIIAVGVVTSVESTGHKSRQIERQGTLTRLLWLQVRVKIENVLRGELSSTGDSVFYYFEWGEWPTQGVNKEHLMPGIRTILFLRKDNGVLRTIVDLYSSHIKITTGSHKSMKIGTGEPVAKTIARLALTPGDDFNPEAFDGNQARMFWADGIDEPIEAAAILVKLLSYPDPRVRDRACIELVDGFQVQEDCLREVTDSDSAILGKQSQERLSRTQASMRSRLESASLNELERSLSVSDTDKVWRQLVILLLSSDRSIRETSCKQLHSYFPGRKYPEPFANNCP
jgi:hypothetical protein